MAFAAGETFLVLERSSTHWWLAARARSGETGYVPPAYLHRLQVSVSLPARPLFRTPSPVRRTIQDAQPDSPGFLPDREFENLTLSPKSHKD